MLEWTQWTVAVQSIYYLHSFVLTMCIYNILLLSCQCARGWGWGWKKFTAGMGGDGDEMPWGWVGTAMKLCGDGWDGTENHGEGLGRV